MVPLARGETAGPLLAERPCPLFWRSAFCPEFEPPGRKKFLPLPNTTIHLLIRVLLVLSLATATYANTIHAPSPASPVTPFTNLSTSATTTTDVPFPYQHPTLRSTVISTYPITDCTINTAKPSIKTATITNLPSLDPPFLIPNGLSHHSHQALKNSPTSTPLTTPLLALVAATLTTLCIALTALRITRNYTFQHSHWEKAKKKRRRRLHYNLYRRCLNQHPKGPPSWFYPCLHYVLDVCTQPTISPTETPHTKLRPTESPTNAPNPPLALLQSTPSTSPPNQPLLPTHPPPLPHPHPPSRSDQHDPTLDTPIYPTNSPTAPPPAHITPPPDSPSATPSHQPLLHLLVSSPSGRTITIELPAASSVLDLKLAIQQKDGIPPHLQQLSFNRTHLVDTLPLQTYDLTNNSSVNLRLALLGGTPPPPPESTPDIRNFLDGPRKKSQQRAAKWREKSDLLTEYLEVSSSVDRPIFPSVEELRAAASRELKSKNVRRKGLITDHFDKVQGLTAARLEQEHVAKAIAEQIKSGGFGHVPEQKDDNIGRFVFENYNSLSLWGDGGKIRKLNKLLTTYDADCALGVETQVQWALAKKSDSNLKLDRLLLPGQDKRVVTGYNVHEDFSRAQHGGTCIATFNRLSQFVQDSGSDPHKLGRWSWMQLGAGQVSTRIVSAYLPCTTKLTSCEGDLKYETVYNQHSRYFRSIGDNRCPRTIFVDHLAQQIAIWRSAGEQVLVFTDANSCVYRGMLAKRLSEPDTLMRELCLEITGKESPNSHFRGQLPLTGVFATPGLVGVNAFQTGHGGGIGDHRMFVIDMDLTSMIGEDFPKIVRLPGRKLQAKKSNPRKAYIKSLKRNIKRHRLTEKYEDLAHNHAHLNSEEKQTAINKLDTQKTEFMTCAESDCRKIKRGTIPYSPTIANWIARRRVFAWMLRHKLTPVKDPRNLFRKCKVLDRATTFPIRVRQPRDYTVEQVKVQIIAIDEQIEALRDCAPDLRYKHLKKMKVEAEKKGNTRRATEIEQIIQREHLSYRYRNIKCSTTPKKGGGKVFKIEKRAQDDVVTSYCTKEDIEAVAGQTIGERYRLAYSAPIMCNPDLLRDIGIAGDGPAMQSILEGTYTFPPDTDEYTKLLVTEACIMYNELGGDDGVADLVSKSDFQNYWKSAREKTESSMSGKHFGHYIAGAHDDTISQLHATSLNTIRELGISPSRWRCSVTVLLEKVLGVRLVDKLRAICLIEADFNWLNKLIFAHRLERHCRAKKLVPSEQFQKSQSNCQEASLVKNLSTDNSRILHNSFAIVSADLDQCFDRSNGAIAGLAARAHGVSEKSTKLMLNTMQLMQYFVKSGFGIAKEPSFGGSEDDRLMSLGQGSGAAPIGMRNIITLTDNAYKRLGHGMDLKSSITQRLFLLASIIYVDDTDLLHWADFYGMSDEDFVEKIQKGLHDWGMLVQASGGSLKQSKSFWYLLSWKFTNGKPILKPQSALPSSPLLIPQPDGSTLPIPRKENDHTEKTLGVWNNPINDPKVGLEKIQETGLSWVDSIKARPLERRDVWLSLTCQQYPKWGYGISSLYASPEQLDKTTNSIYRQALPLLGFNRNIATPLRTLPSQFQGMNLRQWSIEKLSSDIAILLRHWNSDSTLGNTFLQVYESFQMEIGLNGNIFSRPYSKLKDLATHSWFKLLWQYASKYDVHIEMKPQFCLKPTRLGDIALMELFISRGYSAPSLVSLNRVRKYYKVHSLADILLADGKTVNASIVTRQQLKSSRTFSWEQPTPSDFATWNTAIRLITSPSLSYPRRLGNYTQQPHIVYEWFASPDKLFLYHTFTGGYDIFQRSTNQVTTRSGPVYTKISTAAGPPPTDSLYASVLNYTYNQAQLHSTCPQFTHPTHNTSFLQQLHSSSDQLWTNLDADDDGSWLLESIENGTLVAACDGSYMSTLSDTSCSGAFILHCTSTKKEIRGCFTDSSSDSDNYRGEILGAIGATLLIDTALKTRPLTNTPSSTPTITLYCDNRGVVIHGNAPSKPLKDGQAQADLLRLLKTYSRSIPANLNWVHIKGHADDNLPFELLSFPQQLNVRCDKLAKRYLKTAITTNTFTPPTFPGEDIVISVNSTKIRSSIKKAIYKHWGRKTAKSFYMKRDKVPPWCFDDIHWDDMQQVMDKFPKTFQDWTTRHISDFNGCNRYLSRWKEGVKNRCPSCLRKNEDTAHITRCRDPTRTTLYLQDVDSLCSWLSSNHTPADVTVAYKTYLRGRGKVTMAEATQHLPRLHDLAAIQDAIGFDNLLVGRLPKMLLPLVQPSLRLSNRRGLTPNYWAKNFSYQLLLFTHKQWVYRNSTVHYKPSEGKTVQEHEIIDQHIQSLLQLDPESLLPHHRSLLSDKHARLLGSATSAKKQFWIAEVQAALNESAIVLRLKRKKGKTETIYVTRNSRKVAVQNITSPLFPSQQRQSKRNKPKKSKK